MNAVIVVCLAILVTVSAFPSIGDHENDHHNGSIPLVINVTETKFARGYIPFTPKDMSEVTGISFEEYLQVSSSKRAANFLPPFPANSQAVDWVKAGAVGPILAQGGCGSCWTFATADVMYSAFYIKTGKKVSFSQQQLVDCSTEQPNDGCNGGNGLTAYKYISTNGLTSSGQYPYKMSKWQEGQTSHLTCTYNKNMAQAYTVAANPYVYLNQWVRSGNYLVPQPVALNALTQALYNSPVSVTICSSMSGFGDFRGPGAYTPPQACTRPDHAVVAVAYYPKQNYITLKNSWDTWWGVNGYANISVTPGTAGASFFSDAHFPNL